MRLFVCYLPFFSQINEIFRLQMTIKLNIIDEEVSSIQDSTGIRMMVSVHEKFVGLQLVPKRGSKTTIGGLVLIK